MALNSAILTFADTQNGLKTALEVYATYPVINNRVTGFANHCFISSELIDVPRGGL